MKSLPLLGALLFSASVAITDDFAYVTCDTEGTFTFEQSSTNESEVTEMTHVFHFKIDQANSRMMDSGKDAWVDIDFVDGFVVQKFDGIEGQSTSQGQLSLVFPPPGKISLDMLLLYESGSMKMVAKGVCQDTNASVFEKALSQ